MGWDVVRPVAWLDPVFLIIFRGGGSTVFLLAWLGSGLCGKMGRKLIFGIISDFVRG